MPNPANYYPSSNEGRADWWDNLRQSAAAAAFTASGLPGAEVSAIANDALMGVYVYRTARAPFDKFNSEIIAILNLLATGTDPSATPVLPTVPTLQGLPDVAPLEGFELRRGKWVARVKSLPGYTVAIGIALGTEAAAAPFDPATYQAEISALNSPSARVLAGKFRKAYGNIDAMNMHGRKTGTVDYALLKTCLTSPFTLTVQLAGAAPESWEFHGRAVVGDAEIGVASPAYTVLIHG